jgi:hypothetical protein
MLHAQIPRSPLLPPFLCVSEVYCFVIGDSMEQQERGTSPKFYKNAAILFFFIGCFLLWQAIAHHDWVYGAFAGITFLNALMTTLKLISLRETKS